MDHTALSQNPLPQRFQEQSRAWRARLADLSAAAASDLLFDVLSAELTRISPTDGRAARADPHAPWRRLGIYRQRAAALRAALSEVTGVRLSATALFDLPSPAALVEHLRSELLGPARCEHDQPHQDRPAGDHPFDDRPHDTRPHDTRPDGGREDCAVNDDPVVIVAMACRAPGGADSPQALWELVRDGRDVIGDLPGTRGWDLGALYHPDPDHVGTAYTRHGGFLPRVEDFDASFFGIGPREAAALDPQQRLMLEISWEALESAGIDPRRLRGTSSGVFTGFSLSDYGPAWHTAPGNAQGQLLTGTAAGVLSGRVSYLLGLEGPSMSVETQCSASLVAVHLAAQALRAGECDLAFAGGVTVMCTPGMLLEFSRKRGLAPDGRCKAFSADADGTGWAEGAGVLLLERLSDARRHGRQVLAVLRGSAVNSDGASNGLTAPNGSAQQRLVQLALASAGLRPADVDAVEAHGTGTALGDPIEAGALLATYGQQRATPLRLGSLKSNIGHAQAAAGVLGVIKMVQALRHETLPRTLHAEHPSPHVDWSSGAITLLTEPLPWPRDPHRPRRAGVSAFGVSGTNAHVILEEAPLPHGQDPAEGHDHTRPDGGAPLPVVLSGRTPAALRAQAARLGEHLAHHPEADLVDVAHTLAGRTRFEHRAVIVLPGNGSGDAVGDGLRDRDGGRRDRLRAALAALEGGRTRGGLVLREAAAGEAAGRLAMLCTGQGSQRAGMGLALHAAFPVFAVALDEICAAFDAHLDRPLRQVMFADPDTPEAALLQSTAYTQPALFALETALFRLVRSFGLTPALLAGHSIGELTAAHLAGVWTLPDAVAMVAARGRLMQACQPGGVMISIRAGAEEVAASLAGLGGRVEIATVNGPESTVIAGDAEPAARIAAHWAARGHATRALTVSHAFHSPHMDAMLDAFREVAGSVRYRVPALPVVSALTGGLATTELTDPEHWVRHVREPVRFLAAARGLRAAGADAYLELGPDAVLTALLPACLADQASTTGTIGAGTIDTGADGPLAVAASRAGRDEPATLLAAVAALDVHGLTIDWRRAGAGGGRQVDLPTYPFQRRRHWLDAAPDPGPDAGRAAPADSRRGTVQAGVGVGTGVGATPVPRTGPATDPQTGAETGSETGPETDDRADPATWRYQTVWQPLAEDLAAAAVTAHAGPRPPLRGTWALLVPADGVTEPMVTRLLWLLERLGTTPVAVRLSSRPGLDGTGTPGVPHTGGRGSGPGAAGDAERRVLAERLAAQAPDARGVLSLLGLDTRPHPLHPALPTGFAQTVALAQALRDLGSAAPLWALTRGAVATGEDDPVRRPAGALVWGLGRALALEHPAGWGGLVDLPDEAGDDLGDESLAWLGAALLAPGGEDQTAVRATGLLVPRLVPADAGPGTDAGSGAGAGSGSGSGSGSGVDGWRPRGAVLVTGGTGALGAQVARRLATAGARQIVLVSRRGPDAPGAPRLRAELAGLGAETTVVACDVADRGQLVALLADLAAAGTPVRTAVHAAGVAGRTAPLADLDLGEVAEIVAGKVAGAAALDAALAPDAELVLLSSISGVWGSGRQAAYSAGNAYLDALASRRRSAGRPTTAVSFGPWADAGMGAEPALRDFLARRGLRPLAARPAVGALIDAVAAGRATVTVVDVDWDRFLPALTVARPNPMFDALPAAPETTGATGFDAASAAVLDAQTGTGPESGTVAWTDYGAMPAAQRAGALAALVRAEAAAVLGHDDAEDLDPARRFLELGFDSLASVQLARRLSAATGMPLAPPVVFEHPTAAELAAHLAGLAVAAGTDASHPAAARHTGSRPSRDGAPAAALSVPPGASGMADTGGSVYAEGVSGTVRDLYRRACAIGRFGDGVDLIRAAAKLRPTFATAAEFTGRTAPVRLASGPARPTLVCVPSMVAPSGPHNFARLALHLHGRRDVHALTLPGFGEGDRLPASAALAIDLLADVVAGHFADTPAALAGYSSGGWLAHAIAARLEERGGRAAAVVLLDTWFPGDRIPQSDIDEELRGIAVNEQAYALMTEAQVTAQGGYLDLFDGWRPAEIDAPIVLLRAGERMPQQPGADDDPDTPSAAEWKLAHDTVDVAGNHQTMMNEFAASTAVAVHRWLADHGRS